MVEDCADGELRAWIQPETSGDAGAQGPVDWRGGRVDLRACCATGCAGAENAVYRLRAGVHYCNRGKVPGPGVADEGHFTAFFRSGESWYFSDDLDPAAAVRKKPGSPPEYPYICFLERVGDPEIVLGCLLPHEVCVETDLARADESEKLLGAEQ